ncbi:MAG: DUF1385 domain-containing protein [Gaiellaceae bacterium]
MAQDKVRLGGMALTNGVLVHGPTSWACAIRDESGEVRTAAGEKPLQAAKLRSALLRGPARFAEIFALLPRVRAELPQARLPFERASVVASMAVGATLLRLTRASRLHPVAQELVGAAVAFVPAMLALRGGELAAYHGAEHISIGTYEHDEPRAREHERCGTHLVGPLLVSAAVGNMLAAKAPKSMRPTARLGAAIGSLAAATEIFGWMTRHPGHPVARALARPGYEFQHRVATAEPTEMQLEVAQAALDACLELETRAEHAA